MPRHWQVLAITVGPLDIIVPDPTQIPFLLVAAARRRHCCGPPARAVVLVDSPLVKTGPVCPDSGEGPRLSAGTRYDQEEEGRRISVAAPLLLTMPRTRARPS